MAGIPQPQNIKVTRTFEIVCHAMLAPRKHMQRKKVEVYKDAADASKQRNWRKLMAEIEELGSAVPVLKTRRAKEDALPRDLVLGTLVRFKQLKKWDIVKEVLFFNLHFGRQVGTWSFVILTDPKLFGCHNSVDILQGSM